MCKRKLYIIGTHSSYYLGIYNSNNTVFCMIQISGKVNFI